LFVHQLLHVYLSTLILFSMLQPPPTSPLFPYTTLFRSLRNPEAPDIIPQLGWFAERGIAFHTQVVLVPGVNDGVELERTLAALYGLGPAVLSVSVVPVALTEFSKHGLVRVLTRDECRAALTA